jgi:hypothetical protein
MFAGLGAVGLAVLAATAQPAAFGKVRNFRVPEFYDAPNQNQVKSLISGAEAVPLTNGLFLIREVKVETFRETGERDLVLTSPECVYDPRQRTAKSAGPFQAEGGDAPSRLEGEGFCWQADDRMLTISNNVHAVIRLPPPKSDPVRQ